jgi:hypothetical protein
MTRPGFEPGPPRWETGINNAFSQPAIQIIQLPCHLRALSEPTFLFEVSFVTEKEYLAAESWYRFLLLTYPVQPLSLCAANGIPIALSLETRRHFFIIFIRKDLKVYELLHTQPELDLS